MKNFFSSKAKFIIFWLLLTALMSFFISIFQAFSREVTLDNVRAYDFKIVASVLTKSPSSVSDFSIVSNELVNRNGFVLFPLAYITSSGCKGNGKKPSNNKICDIFKTKNDWERAITTEIKNNSYFNVDLKVISGSTYIYKNINGGGILIGLAGDYLKDFGNDIKLLKTFFTKRASGFYLTTTKGWSSLYEKSKWPIAVAFVFSLIGLGVTLAVLYLLEKNTQKDIKLKEKIINNSKENAAQLQTEIDSRKRDVIDLKDQIKSLTENISNSKISEIENERQQNELLEEIIEKEISINQLNEKLFNAEIECENLDLQIQKLQVRLTDSSLKEQLEKYIGNYNKVRKLWSAKTAWVRRREIEEEVAESNRTPFTYSAAFIAFENWVNEYYESLAPNASPDVPLDLREKIRLIEMQQPHQRVLLGQIRRARNEWFHEGIPPKKEYLIGLLQIIEKVPAKV